MGDAQPEQYTKIPNIILEKVMESKFNGTQFKLIMAVCRFTYGFQRNDAELSLSFLSQATGIDVRNIRRELDGLIQQNIIIEYSKQRGTRARFLGVNDHTEQWLEGVNSPRGPIRPEGETTLPREGELTPAREGEFTPQERKPKENNKKNNDTATDRTPYQDIVNLYHKVCVSLPAVRVVSNNRKIHIKARYDQYKQDSSVFDDLFKKAEASDFLTGRKKGINSKYQNFKADFDWLMNEHNMAKVLEGKYANTIRGDPALFKPSKQTTEEKLLALEGY
jgi:phage replication O-like protein O